MIGLPSGRLVRGRGLRAPVPDGPFPDLGIYLLASPPAPMGWEIRWVKWRDFCLPADSDVARAALTDAWRRAVGERIEIACAGGRGRTGTALACLAVLDGLPARDAVAFVREHYHPRAIETPWQRRYIGRFAGR